MGQGMSRSCSEGGWAINSLIYHNCTRAYLAEITHLETMGCILTLGLVICEQFFCSQQEGELSSARTTFVNGRIYAQGSTLVKSMRYGIHHQHVHFSYTEFRKISILKFRIITMIASPPTHSHPHLGDSLVYGCGMCIRESKCSSMDLH